MAPLIGELAAKGGLRGCPWIACGNPVDRIVGAPTWGARHPVINHLRERARHVRAPTAKKRLLHYAFLA